MNDLSPIVPNLAELVMVGNRQAVLLPEGVQLPDDGPWLVDVWQGRARLVRFVEEDWALAGGLAGIMDDEWAAAIEAGRIGPDHPDNALDDDPVFD